LLVHGWWFSLGIPASSTTKTGRHDITEILLKVALNTKNQSISQSFILNKPSLLNTGIGLGYSLSHVSFENKRYFFMI
jgi:hypothetical protein